MKNKKLFAILTLVCFMMTLMPVAAFAAVDPATTVADSTSVVYTDDTDVNVGESSEFGLAIRNLNGDLVTTTVYVWVTKDGSTVPVNTATVNGNGLGELVHEITGQSVDNAFRVAMRAAGTFKVHVSSVEPEITESGRISAASEFNGAPNVVTVSQRNAKIEDLRLKVTLPGNDKYDVVDEIGEDVKLNTNSEFLSDGYTASALNIEANNVDEKEVTIQLDKHSYVYAEAADGAYVRDEDGNYVLADEDTPAGTQKYERTDKYAPQTGKTFKISTAGAIEVNKETVTTNALGQAKFTVSGTAEGTYKVYLTYGQFEVVLEVEVGATAANTIECTDEPENPIDILNEDLTNGMGEYVEFTMYDVNGNELDADNEAGWEKAAQSNNDPFYGYVAVVDQPAKSKLENKNLWFDGDTICSNKAITEEGTYTFKVVLDNGNYATATIEVKEFQTPVKLVVEYPEAIELGTTVDFSDLYWLDANNVEKKAYAGDNNVKVTLAATGYAISNFNSKNGELTAKSDEKYVGNEITITAVDERYNLIATDVVTVADDAKELKFADKTAEVKVNNKIKVNVVDSQGRTVTLGGDKDAQNASVAISYVILDNPEGAKVSATVDSLNLAKGQFNINLTSNKIGNVTVQAIAKVTYTDTVDQKSVVRYYTGTQIFAVGNGSVGDVVVMSIDSNEIVINDAKATIDAAPIVKNDRTFVPFRALAEAFGAEVAYDEATQAVTAELNGVKVVMTIGSATYTVNGAEKTMDVAPFINGSRTMVPVRFVAESFGIKVIPTYDENGATADILFNL